MKKPTIPRNNVAVPPGYHCPMCPNHEDQWFFRTPLCDTPICDGCNVELDFFVLEPYAQLPAYKQKWADILSETAGRSWPDCRLIVLDRNLRHWMEIRADEHAIWRQRMRHWTPERCEAFLTERIEELRLALEDARAEGAQ